MSRRHALLAMLIALCCCSVLLGRTSTVTAAAADGRATRACDVSRATPRMPGVSVQRFASTEVTGGIAVLPDRIVTGIEPGERGQLCVGFHNRTGRTLSLELGTLDIGLTSAGTPAPVEEGLGEYGAAAWLTLPTRQPIRLEHGDLAWITVQVAVPNDASGGSSYAAITGRSVEGDAEADGGAQVQVVPMLAAHIYFDVSGDTATGGKIDDVRSPRVIWWDGAGIGDLPGLERLRGRGSAPIRAEWTNTGSLTHRATPRVDVTSDLGGRRIARLTDRTRYVLRGGRARFEMHWKQDIPLAGRFTPTLYVEMEDGTTVTRKLPAIWVIPAWWYLLVLTIAIAIPVTLRRRSKRRYAELLARLEAAEEREVSVHSDADWDSEEDDLDPH